jgi:SpoIID/LytB domain protein
VATTDVFCSPNVVPVADLKRYLGTVDEGTDYFRWKIDYERADLEQVLRQKFFAHQDPSRIASLATLTNLESIHRGDSGRITELEITYLDPMGAQHKARVSSEYKIRDVLHQKFLYSSAFLIRIERNEGGLPTRISLLGGGWGHGAGLCQIGALGMALKGYDHGAIVRHYFDEAELQSCY